MKYIDAYTTSSAADTSPIQVDQWCAVAVCCKHPPSLGRTTRDLTQLSAASAGLCSALWKDLHSIFFEALPAGTVRYGHKVVAFEQSDDGVAATAEVRTPDGRTETRTFRGDFLVAADGSRSFVRSKLVPGEERRWGNVQPA